MAKPVFDITGYCKKMEQLIGGQDGEAQLFWKALSFGVNSHQGQKRKSGEVYVSHPCEVALILLEEMGVRDPETLAAAMLHDTVEDVPEVTSEVIGEIFGKNVEAIVDGLTKITDFSGSRQAFHSIVHRKLFAGAASRIAVILIKLADRLHNLRTMESMPKHKRQKIAEETLAVYAPMAKVLGLYAVKRELYNLALAYKFPRQSTKVNALIRQFGQRQDVQEIKEHLQIAMEQSWLTSSITIRAKGLSAYYDPANDIMLKEIDKPVQIVIVVNAVQDCYRALGILNQNYPPIPRTIRDYIANPKPTGYQSLHAKANIGGQNYLFKIRTEKMMQEARIGMVKGWLSQGVVPGTFEKDIREMFNILGSDDEISYREMIAASGKQEIYTYTPKGLKICLPRQSIVLDFAFKIHTEIGKHCIGAKVGQKMVGPEHVLQDGDQVEILRQAELVRFEPKILELCQVPRARAELARMFRGRRENLALAAGRSIIEQELKRYGMSAELLQREEMADILESFHLEHMADLYRQIGEGGLRLKDLIEVMRKGLFSGGEVLQPPVGILNRIYFNTLDPACIKFSRCCNPVPTEHGLLCLLSERGFSVHRKNCDRLGALKIQREDVVELCWEEKKTTVVKPQTLHILKPIPRNRIMMLLSVAPDEMKITDVVSLARIPAKESPWEIVFRVDNLHGLKNCLRHFDKAGMEYEFAFEQ